MSTHSARYNEDLMRKQSHRTWLTVSEAGHVVDVTRQAVSVAITRGNLLAEGWKGRRRIDVEDVVRYAVGLCRPLDEVIERLGEELDLDLLSARTLVLEILGLQKVIRELERRHRRKTVQNRSKRGQREKAVEGVGDFQKQGAPNSPRP